MYKYYQVWRISAGEIFKAVSTEKTQNSMYIMCDMPLNAPLVIF